ncbi:MAG: hypothetical protein RQ891_08300 [Thermoflexus sp.]|jgi:hypothetical protein|uniref:hypothetical protein n=1 Tax=Thermoflexus TaxID=1495649 RepID=UPI001C75BFA2|nr:MULTISPECIES: hypothetical protein [Thermoflexus]MDT7884838.1 hypothetical protein [Thermoflexus sp.]MDT7948747.1 hypothetical protein [Thermoflexus sp.]QWK10639.1 MAG: hypothetical protein KNN16_14935 [Thermoflexus hugenholtzii]
MPRIRCHYVDCVYLEAGMCTADEIELDPEMGCLTYTQAEEEEWEEEEVVPEEEEELELDDEEWEEIDLEEDEEDEEW